MAEPTGAWVLLTGPSYLSPLTLDILCPLGLLSSPAPEGLRLEPAPPLTLKASCSSSTMLEESSCSTPSDDTGKYVCSFCGKECRGLSLDGYQLAESRQQLWGHPHFADRVAKAWNPLVLPEPAL